MATKKTSIENVLPEILSISIEDLDEYELSLLKTAKGNNANYVKLIFRGIKERGMVKRVVPDE